MFDFLTYLGRSPRAELFESPEIKWVLTGISQPFINNVFYAHPASDQIDETIAKTVALLLGVGFAYYGIAIGIVIGVIIDPAVNGFGYICC